jgi:hypothetical protein
MGASPMMFIVRTASEAVSLPSPQVKLRRKTPETVANANGKTDYFCVGDTEDIAALRTEGCEIVELRDGWYIDDAGGGIAIFGQGRYWEVRDTPFTVREAAGPAPSLEAGDPGGDDVNVRGAIFGV